MTTTRDYAQGLWTKVSKYSGSYLLSLKAIDGCKSDLTLRLKIVLSLIRDYPKVSHRSFFRTACWSLTALVTLQQISP